MVVSSINFTLKFCAQKNKKGTVMIIGPTIKKYAQIFVLSIPYFNKKTCSNPGPLFQKPCVPHIKNDTRNMLEFNTRFLSEGQAVSSRVG
jgi:hypothetical protein